MTDFVRGQTVHFSATFTDANGDSYTPDAPIVVVDFPSGRLSRDSISISLSSSGSAWVGDWDSSEAGRAGKVYWTVYSGSPNPKIADDGSFALTANTSNRIAVPAA